MEKRKGTPKGTGKAPLDTPLGIMQAVQEVNAEARKTSGRREQCPCVHSNPRTGNTVFCTKDKGHVEAGDPEHHGYRKKWTDADAKNVNVGNAHDFVRSIRPPRVNSP